MASAGIQGRGMIMKQLTRLFVILMALSGVLLLTGCGTSSGTTTSVNYGVYSGYGYPYYGHDNDNYYYYNNRPNRPDRPDRPNRPDRPSTQPVYGGGMGRPGGGMSRGGFGGGGRGRGGGRGGRR